MNADTRLVSEVCRLVAEQPGDTAALVANEVRRLAPLRTTDEQGALAEQAIAHLTGLGELDAFLRDPTVDEVLVNGGGDVWIDRRGDLANGHLSERLNQHQREQADVDAGEALHALDRAHARVAILQGQERAEAPGARRLRGEERSVDRRSSRHGVQLGDAPSNAVLVGIGDRELVAG